MTQKEESTLLGYRIGCSAGFLIFTMLMAIVLVKLKPETETRAPKEAVVRARLIPAVPEDIVVTVTSHGVARPTRVVTLSSEVAGRVIERSPLLDEGVRVEQGQTLLVIDPTDYQASVREAEASLARLNATLNRLNTTETTTRSQVEVSKRSRDLAKADFDRLFILSQEGRAVSQAVAESAERTLAQAEGQFLQLEQTLELLPSQRTETQSEILAAEARLSQANTQLERTRVVAPFRGRIVTSMVEEDSYLAPGSPIVELADDRELELHVSVQADELQKWIPFQEQRTGDGWFPSVQPAPVQIEWTGSEEGVQWTGTLDRVASFDATTRMAMLVISISPDQLAAEEGTFPLTDGMFCRVSIPGKTLTNVFALPREAVTFDQKVYLSENGRLRTVDVTVAWETEDTVYVSEGIQAGDLVVGTRLVAPLEGIKLQDLQD